jgi:hypothetical protein
MTTSTANDAPLLELTDAGLARPLPAPLRAARAGVVEAALDLLAIPETSLAKPWPWIGGGEEEVRYGAYRAFEAVEQAEVEARAAASGTAVTRAARIIAPATTARWELHGLLLPLDDRVLDTNPGGGEWTIRQTVAHTVSAQRGYGWASAWWQANPHRAGARDLPSSAPESLREALPDDEAEGQGTGEQVRARLDAILDLAAERLAGLPDDRLELGARWSGFAVTVGFRLARWSSHIREHTIQVEKSFALLGTARTEPERLVGLLLGAYGRAESTVFGREQSKGVTAAAERIAAGVEEAREALRSARSAGEA